MNESPKRKTREQLLASAVLALLERLFDTVVVGANPDSEVLDVWSNLRDTYKPELERIARGDR